MMLTREQAIIEHRKMWYCIAREIMRLKEVIDIYDYKHEYLHEKGLYHIKNNCFLCEYCREEKFYFDFDLCEKCPLDWGYLTNERFYPCEGDFGSDNPKEYGLWWKCQKAKTWEEQYKLAVEIASLPERKDA